MRQNKKYPTMLYLLFASIMLMMTGCGGGDEPLAQYKESKDASDMVEVTDEEFTRFKSMKQLNDPYFAQRAAIDPDFEETLLKQYISLKIYQSQIPDDEMEQLKEDSELAYDGFRQDLEENPDWEEQWNQVLDSLNITEEDYLEYVLLQNGAIHQIEKNITEEQIRQHYDEAVAADPYAYLQTATVSHILIEVNDDRTSDEALELAEDIKTQLDNGADFAELAKTYSDDPGSKDNGGTYTDANINAWDPDFRKAVLELPLNEISDPVETAFGYHLIRVEQREAPSYEEVKSIVEGELVEQQFAEFMEQELPDYLGEMNLPEQES